MLKRPLKGIRALVVVLGVHGGGVANAKWLLKQGAKVTVTDERDANKLAESLARFTPSERKKIHFVLGGQRKEDFRRADLILFGPGVHEDSPWRRYALKLGKHIENDASLFLGHAEDPTIAVTGTRGKTTTTQWIASLLKKKYPEVRASGNTPENALMSELERLGRKKNTPAVLELSSWQLELAPAGGVAPHIAAITNLYPDHLNTYSGMNAYADAKANIFLDQEPHDALILNRDNKWWKYFLKKGPRSQIFFISKKKLPDNSSGAYVHGGALYYKEGKKTTRLFDVARHIKERGEHNLENLLVAVLAVKLFDPKLPISEKDIFALPTPRMREEIIHRKGSLTVVNDSCATSPDGTIAAIERFQKNGRIILIAGGTDKKLEFSELAKVIKRHIKSECLILLEGSGTAKLKKALKISKFQTPSTQEKKTLKECVEAAFSLAKRTKDKTVILFSPGAASFEKFKHEFDRGEQFNTLIGRYIQKK